MLAFIVVYAVVLKVVYKVVTGGGLTGGNAVVWEVVQTAAIRVVPMPFDVLFYERENQPLPG